MRVTLVQVRILSGALGEKGESARVAAVAQRQRRWSQEPRRMQVRILPAACEEVGHDERFIRIIEWLRIRRVSLTGKAPASKAGKACGPWGFESLTLR